MHTLAAALCRSINQFI